jgi:hypothetical protein
MSTNLFLETPSLDDKKEVLVGFLGTHDKAQIEQDRGVIEVTSSNAEKASGELANFYKITLTRLPEISIGTREEIDEKTERQTEAWVVGVRSRNGLCLLDPRLYANTAPQFGLIAQTKHTFSEEDYFKLIKHELGHEYFHTLLDLPYEISAKVNGLLSLNEGLQFYLAGQLSNDESIFEKFNPNNLSAPDKKGYYQSSAMVVRRLVEMYDSDAFVEKLTILLNNLRNFYDTEINKDMPISTQLNSAYYQYYNEAFGLVPTSENLDYLVRTGTLPIMKSE